MARGWSRGRLAGTVRGDCPGRRIGRGLLGLVMVNGHLSSSADMTPGPAGRAAYDFGNLLALPAPLLSWGREWVKEAVALGGG